MSLVQSRTPPGKSGRQLKLRINAFLLTQVTEGLVQHFDVDFPSGVSKEDRCLYLKFLCHDGTLFQGANPLPIAFDGKRNLYMLASGKMPDKDFTVNEDVAKKIKPPSGAKPKICTIKIKHANTIPMNSLVELVKGRSGYNKEGAALAAIQALNIAMTKTAIFDNGFPFKHAKFYVPKSNAIEGKLLTDIHEGRPVQNLLQGACEIWGGYFMSIRPGMDKLMLNINRVSGTIVKEGNLVSILMEMMNVRDINRANPRNPQMPKDVRFKIIRFLKGMYVRCSHRDPKSKFSIKSVSPESAKTFTFEVEGGKRSNVADFFLKTYNIKLKYPDLPVVSITKMAFVPLEVCSVWPGSNFFSRLSAAQTSELLKSRYVTLHPRLKRQAIELGLKQISINSPFHQSWNLQIKPDFMEINARQLPSPELVYRNGQGKNQIVKTNDGAWMTKGCRALRAGVKVDRWVVVVFAGDHPSKPPAWDGMPVAQTRDALTGFIKGCKEFGITFANEQPCILHVGNTQQVKEAIVAVSKKAGYTPQSPPNLVVTFSYGSNQYDKIKQVCDIQLGVPSQNLTIGKADGNRGGYWVNVAFKVNSKLQGVNQIINNGLVGFKAVPTMLLGADVTHPSPSSCQPSISAVVASFDKEGVEYGCITHVQDSKLEVLEDLASTVTQHLKSFFQHNKVKPARIIFYRDGVSEGQFQATVTQEVAAIRDACMGLDKSYKPSITFIVCAKRHHFQFFPVNEKEMDRSGNAKAGTVVDTDIVHPCFDDYYLLSHAGLLGTSKPCHYTILQDDAKLGKDAIQTLTYQLAYIMPRATRSISIAAPAAYAHLACDRARKHIGKIEESGDMMTATDDEKRTQLLDMARRAHSQINAKLKNVMYYM